MLRIFFTFVFVVIFSASAWAGNWNSVSPNSSEQKLNVNNPIEALTKVGVNSMALWSSKSYASPNDKDAFLSHFKPLQSFGVKHVVLVSCADWVVKVRCYRSYHNLEGIIKSAILLLENTELHVVVQLKAYDQRKINGKYISWLNTELEKDDSAVAVFIQTWERIARELQMYPAERLSFNLLNEPEFQQPMPSRKKRDRWLSIAEKTARAIRGVSPERTIIVEGIGKSLFAKRSKNGGYKKEYSPDNILKPIDLDNIIYAFHQYEPREFLQQADYNYGSFGRAYTKKHASWVAKDASRAISWANKHNVPIMLTETGCIGFLEGKEGPKTNDECGKYAADVYKHYIEKGVGVTWWALEKEMTIYNRNCDKKCWMPDPLEPNSALFKGLRLNMN